MKVSTKGPPAGSTEQSRGQRPSPGAGAAGEGRVGSVGRGGEGAGLGAATLLFLMTYLEAVSNLRKHCQAEQRAPMCPSSRRPQCGPFTASLRHAFPRACVRACVRGACWRGADITTPSARPVRFHQLFRQPPFPPQHASYVQWSCLRRSSLRSSSSPFPCLSTLGRPYVL